MVGWFLKATLSMLVVALFGYVAVTVPVGRRTLFEHGLAIAKTQPARELAEDVSRAASETADKVREKMAKK